MRFITLIPIMFWVFLALLILGFCVAGIPGILVVVVLGIIGGLR